MLEEKTQPTRLSMILLIFLMALGGCASDETGLVNEAAMAHRISPSDLSSRDLAMETMPLIENQALDYKVGTDDVLAVEIFEWMVREELKTVEVRVTEVGFVTLPLLGSVEAKGKTVAQIEDTLESQLIEKGLIKIPRVNVIVKEYRSKTVAVVGAVENPGRFSIRQNVITLLDAMALAGGLDERAGYVLFVVRPLNSEGLPSEPEATVQPGSPLAETLKDPKKEVITVDTYELYQEGNLSLNVVLRHGDVVWVPEAPMFYVMGFVRQPGGFALKRPTTVLDGIALAQGLMDADASPRHCALKRKLPDGEVVIPLDLVAISLGEQPNLYLQTNDIIDVRQTGWKKFYVESMDFIKRIFHVGYNIDFNDDD